jgi:acyl-CoA synthetase (AMP-forming)/AMP-acid ligase II
MPGIKTTIAWWYEIAVPPPPWKSMIPVWTLCSPAWRGWPVSTTSSMPFVGDLCRWRRCPNSGTTLYRLRGPCGGSRRLYPPSGRASGLVVPSAIAVRRQAPWFAVKDRGSCDAAGWFYHEGRSDGVIISAGWTMSAVEIEHRLLTHVLVVEAAVIGVPGVLWWSAVGRMARPPLSSHGAASRVLV